MPDQNKMSLPCLSKIYAGFELMKKRGQFPYEWFDDIEKSNFDIDIRNSMFYLRKGLALQKKIRVVGYKQSKWLTIIVLI